jgi:raffinose/stachyose/melibiose transport system permease protein
MKNFSAARVVRLRRLGLTGAVFVGALLGVVARAAEVTLDIPLFAGGYGTAFYEETARQFEALRPGVRVNLYGDPRIADKVRVRVIDGHLPDATLTSELLWPVLIRAGKVLDLTAALAGPNWEGDARWGDTFLPGALDAWRMDGRTYGLPFTYACWTIFYNKALFRAHGWEEPRIWDEFFALGKKIRAAGLVPLSLPGTSWRYADAFLRAASHNLLGDAAWRALSDPTAVGARLDPRYVRAAGLLQRVTREELAPGWEGESHTGAEQAFLSGRAAMTVSGSWFFNEMGKNIVALPPGFELGEMNFPVFADGAADPTTIHTGSDCFFVFATGNAERERLTVDFLRFLTSRERAEAFVRSANSPVAVRGVTAAAFAPMMADTVAMIAQAKAAFSMPEGVLQPPALRQALIDASQLLTTGKITPQAFAERMEAAAATDRARVAEPDRVEAKHGLAAGVLLAVVSGLAGWLAWGRMRRRFQKGKMTGEGARPTDSGEGDANYLGPLRGRFALGFVGPALLLYGVLVVLPGVAALAWAFTRWDGLGARTWAGFFNFKWLLLESDTFWFALKNNLYLMLVPALVVVPTALLFAAMIHRGVWGAKVFRVVLLFPNLLGGIAAALLWMNAYNPHGLVNAALVKMGLAGFDGFAWLSQDHLYAALIPIYLWMACGFNLVIYLAAMQGIPAELYEAAELEGASKARQFFTITLPLIREVLVVSAVFLVIGGLNAFELVWLLTSQAPASGTHTLGTLMVSTMFQDFQIGRATAIAVVMFALVLVGSAAVMRALRRETVER